MKLTALLLFACTAVAPCLTGCASTNPSVTVSTVGPASDTRTVAGADGYLQVFSATHTVDADFHAYFNPHSPYRIQSLAGQTVKFVANHDSDEDEAPDVVGIAPGRYNIVAESTWYGTVTVPVVVEQGKTTVIHLDGRWRGGAQNTALVHLPNGETVGWSAAASQP